MSINKQGLFLGVLGGGAPLLTFLLILGRPSPPKTLELTWLFWVYWSCFQSAMINCALLHRYWGISYCWLYYISIEKKLSCFHLWKNGRDCSWATPELRAWLPLEPPLSKFLWITTVNKPSLTMDWAPLNFLNEWSPFSRFLQPYFRSYNTSTCCSKSRKVVAPRCPCSANHICSKLRVARRRCMQKTHVFLFIRNWFIRT